jgi:hypothetical protein
MLVLVRKARSRLGPCGEKRTDLGDFRIFSLFVPKGRSTNKLCVPA